MHPEMEETIEKNQNERFTMSVQLVTFEIFLN
jgi:hypothetical protein